MKKSLIVSVRVHVSLLSLSLESMLYCLGCHDFLKRKMFCLQVQ